MEHQEFNFRYKQYELFAQYWKTQNMRAAVVLVHGMGEHSTRYTDYVIPELLKNGIAVLTFDNFGHGKSSGKRGHCPGYEAIMELVDQMLAKAKALFENVPLFLYGHSMGGNVVINYTLRHKPQIVGTIATSPFLKLAFQPPGWKISIGKLLQRIAPSITLPTELEVEAISKDVSEVNKYKEDPLVHDRISPNFSFPVMEAGEWALSKAGELEAPMLLLHGTADRIIDHKATAEFNEKAGNASLKLYEGGYHELHNDEEKEKLLEDIVNWINVKLQ
ncbi:alpha/beta fold hydrolase [Leptobacterium flavescens]|uniref:Alpha/beta fold hydrolase n=1 Tax=Leptobacterium flavescens TaxID=472055 RepID=A0A6P0UL36_9FLAO|nr:alpha/beta hydrolase [Leptobacterium flavescens]NER13934.1 alpha/beta fold hydrolase [Leptobacterium flavescens]